MKRILFSVILGLAVFQFANAQEYLIEVIGEGVLNDPNPVISYDPVGVVKVEVEAIYFHFDPQADMPQPVYVNGQEITYENVDIHYSAGAASNEYNKGYYRAALGTLPVSGELELDKNGHGDDVVSFYAYVYREKEDYEYSLLNPESEIAFLHAMGEDFPVEATFTLEPAVGYRDLTFTVPISDNEHLDADDRIAVITLEGDGIDSKTVVLQLNDGVTNFYLQEFSVPDVDPAVTEVTIKIYSPSPYGTGDSFYAGTIALIVKEKPEQNPGCTLTQGYWKTHSEHGPAPYDDTWAQLSEDGADTEFYLSEMSWYEVFWTPVKGDVYYQLAHQYMAAYLNMLNGASMPAEVQDAMAEAEDLFEVYKPGELSKENGELAELLDDYNNGYIGPGHCDEMDESEMEQEEKEVQVASQDKGNSNGKAKGKNKSARIESGLTLINDLKVFPNPVMHSATVLFSPVTDGRATVDLYNSVGQRLSRLMDRNVQSGVPVSLTLNGQEFTEGLYILRVQNGNGNAVTRIQIGR